MTITFRRAGLVVIAGVLVLWVTGCGGGGDSSEALTGGDGDSPTPAITGSLHIVVQWPERVSPQAIPQAAESIYIELSSESGGRSTSVAIVRPATEATLREVPTGPAVLAAYACDGADWYEANVLATARRSVNIVEGDNAPVALDLGPLPQFPTSTLFPLAIGNEWTYQVTDYINPPAPAELESSRRGLPAPAQADGQFLLAIVGNGICAGAVWFNAIVLEQGVITDYMYLLHNPTGFRSEGSPWSFQQNYLLKNPLAVGTEWRYPDRSATRTIAGVNETVVVPAGTFRGCLLVEEQGDAYGSLYRDWFAPGVGLLKEERYYIGILTGATELVQYQLVGP